MTYFLTELVVYASKQLKENTLGNINNACEHSIMKPVFVNGIAFQLFESCKGPGCRLYHVQPKRASRQRETNLAGDCPLLPLGGWSRSWAAHGARAQSAGSGPGAGCGLLRARLGAGLALGVQNHQAFVTVIWTDCCSLSTQRDQVRFNLFKWSWVEVNMCQDNSSLLPADKGTILLPALLAPSYFWVLLHPSPIPLPIPPCSSAALCSFMQRFRGAIPRFKKCYVSGFQTGGAEGSQCRSRPPSLSGTALSCASWQECSSTSEH